MKVNVVPKDSVLHAWMHGLSITEVPVSYQILTGLSVVGALLKRSVFVDQVQWRVYPNLSVLLVGPSGIGKDVAINKARDFVHNVEPRLVLGGTTIEFIKNELVKLADPAAAFIPANELSAFLGSKDYQKGIVQELTDLLSTGNKVLLGTKGEGSRTIVRPTITMQAGSTEEWLANLPDKSIEGGFLPRFVIVCESFGDKNIAWVKYDNEARNVSSALNADTVFRDAITEIRERFYLPTQRYKDEREMTPTAAAIDYYRNWYYNRFKYFSKSVRAYANRSRDQVHRLAMLMAVTRMHGFLEDVDYIFAATVMKDIAKGIDHVVAPMLSKRR